MSAGHIRRRGQSSFEIKYEIEPDPQTGARRSRTRTIRGTRRDAQLALAKALLEEANGTAVDPTKLTVIQFIEKWLRDAVEPNLAPATCERYRNLVNHYLLPAVGNVPLQKLRPIQLAELYASLSRSGGKAGEGLRPKTIGLLATVVRQALNQAVTWQLVPQNVATAVKRPKVEREEIQILSPDELKRVLKYLEGRTLRSIVCTLLATGMRRSEALALRWCDIDLDRGIISINASLEYTAIQGVRRKDTKTTHGRRSIGIGPWLIAELRAHRARQLERRLALGLGRPADDLPVFASWDGKFRVPIRTTQRWIETMRELGLNARLHALRHAHVSQLISDGADVLTVSRRLGHANASITLNVYAHLFRNTDAAAAETSDRFMRGLVD